MTGARSPEMPNAFGWFGQIVAFQSTTASKSASSPREPGMASAAGVSSGAKELFATRRMRRFIPIAEAARPNEGREVRELVLGGDLDDLRHQRALLTIGSMMGRR
jgi:hypothetical protein